MKKISVIAGLLVCLAGLGIWGSASRAEEAVTDLVDVTLHPPWTSVIPGMNIYREVVLTSDSVVPIAAVEILIEWDVSTARLLDTKSTSTLDEGIQLAPLVRSNLELIEVEPLGTWFVAGFLPDPDGINDDIADGQALYTLLAPVGWPVGQPVATPNGTPVLRLKFKVRATGSLEIVPAAGVYGETRVFLYGVPNMNVTGNNSDTSSAYICCGC